MKQYRIPMVWEVYGTLDVEANSLEEAIAYAISDDAPLPTQSHYVEGSLEVEIDMANDINEE